MTIISCSVHASAKFYPVIKAVCKQGTLENNLCGVYRLYQVMSPYRKDDPFMSCLAVLNILVPLKFLKIHKKLRFLLRELTKYLHSLYRNIIRQR